MNEKDLEELIQCEVLFFCCKFDIRYAAAPLACDCFPVVLGFRVCKMKPAKHLGSEREYCQVLLYYCHFDQAVGAAINDQGTKIGSRYQDRGQSCTSFLPSSFTKNQVT